MNHLKDSADRLSADFDVLDTLIGQAPTLGRYFRSLTAHHPASGRHVMRVTLTAIDTARHTGLQPLLAGLVSFGHDSGKDQIPQMVLEGKLPSSIMRVLIRTPHMSATRKSLRAVPDKEFKPYDKQLILAAALGHHDLLPNQNDHDQYPRRHQLPHMTTERRTPPDDRTLLWQLYLTLIDKADRIEYGFAENGRTGWQPLRERLVAAVASGPLRVRHVLPPNLIPAIVESTYAMRPEVVDEGIRRTHE